MICSRFSYINYNKWILFDEIIVLHGWLLIILLLMFTAYRERIINMKGIILAGGSGTRLYPLTKAISKQIMPVYDKPMIYYPLSTLMLAGIREVLSYQHQGICLYLRASWRWKPAWNDIRVCRSGEAPRGLADAFIIGDKFIGNDRVALVLGDNIFYGQSFSKVLERAAARESGATIFGYYVRD